MLTLKINKTIGLLQKLQNLLPRSALIITIYKALIRSHLDYVDMIYEEAYNSSFNHKPELFQYSACLAITGAIRGTSKENPYQELGLKSLQLRRCLRKLGYLSNIFHNEVLSLILEI